jgi:hypothetical protein
VVNNSKEPEVIDIADDEESDSELGLYSPPHTSDTEAQVSVADPPLAALW